MHDRAVRRRRAVLVVLVATSLILLTAYFGESSNGRLHSVQGGVVAVLAPVQEGANRVTKPVRDLFGWFGDTLDAKGQRDAAERRVQVLNGQVQALQGRLTAAQQAAGLKQQDTSQGMENYGPVDAKVYVHSPSSWYQTVQIDHGSSDGIAIDDPVINGFGLVGKIDAVTGNTAHVTLITSPNFAVPGLTGGGTDRPREPGTVVSTPGSPDDLSFEFVDNIGGVHVGDNVFTAGTTPDAGKFRDLYPADILIGTVRKIDGLPGELDRTVHIKPVADILHIDRVQVLTEPHADVRAQVK
jgi:rod shape-determining protein MreC